MDSYVDESVVRGRQRPRSGVARGSSSHDGVDGLLATGGASRGGDAGARMVRAKPTGARAAGDGASYDRTASALPKSARAS